ncbi:glycosyltransferase [Hymenobacter arizonensis]|nr:glycosyltransferase [Hymenobacter arizonensis]
MDPKLGGVSQAVRTTIAGLAELGIHNEVVSLDASGSPVDPFPLHAVGPGYGPWSYSPKLLPWLLDNFARFDSVLLHGLWLYNGYALRKALHRFQAQQAAAGSEIIPVPKLFVMPHGMLDPYFQRATGRKLKAWRNQLYWQLVEGAVVNEAAGVLFTCETERLLAREPFAPYRPHQELVVGLGVEPPPCDTPAMRVAFAAKCPALQNRPYLLFLSRIHDKKGVELLIQAYAHLRIHMAASTIPLTKPAPVLVIAGPGLETAYGQQMQRLAAELPEASVLFPGMLTGEAKWGAFYGCEAFVLPSHQENFGIAVVEALACSKPVLVSNQVNIWREIVAMNGGLAEDDTLPGTQRLLEGWCELAEHEKQVMSERAQATYRMHFAVGPAAAKMAAVLY